MCTGQPQRSVTSRPPPPLAPEYRCAGRPEASFLKMLLFTKVFALGLISGIKIDMELDIQEDTAMEELMSSLSEDNLNKEMLKQVCSGIILLCTFKSHPVPLFGICADFEV